MRRRTTLTKLLDRISFYEWPYGRLAESDADIGPVAEFLVGRLLKCLPVSRAMNSLFDLELSDGKGGTVGIEVKSTTHKVKQQRGKVFDYEWHIRTQLACLKGERPLAPVWVFLAASFPEGKSDTPRFDVFDVRYWQVWVATGEQIRSSGVRNRVAVTTLTRLGVQPIPLSDLPAAVKRIVG